MDLPNSAKGQQLPIEIILAIIGHVVPPNPGTIFSPSHVVTRTLLAVAQVCHATSHFASRLLCQHCVYLDSSERSIAFLRTLNSASGDARSHLFTPTQMYLSPFMDQQDAENASEESSTNANDLEGDSPDLSFSSPLNDPSVAMVVCELLIAVAPTLQRLVIDMPLRSLRPADDHQRIRPLLREGFSALVNMEEFVSVQDELYLDVCGPGFDEPEVWATCWPKLRFLALYNPDLYVMDANTNNWRLLAGLPHLETVVFSRPDGVMEEEWQQWHHDRDGIDVKKRWLDALSANMENDGPTRSRDITMCFVDISSRVFHFTRHHPSWQERDPEGRIRVAVCGVPFPDPQSCEIDVTQGFVKKHALEGGLFDGELFEDVS